MRAPALAFFLIQLFVGVSASDAKTDDTCIFDNAERQDFEARMRATMAAHAPIEFRVSCGVQDAANVKFYEAIREALGCRESETYARFFGAFLTGKSGNLFAAGAKEFSKPAEFAAYCQLVEKLDLDKMARAVKRRDKQKLGAQQDLLKQIQALADAQKN